MLGPILFKLDIQTINYTEPSPDVIPVSLLPDTETHLSFSLLNVIGLISSVSRLQTDSVLLQLPHLKEERETRVQVGLNLQDQVEALVGVGEMRELVGLCGVTCVLVMCWLAADITKFK